MHPQSRVHKIRLCEPARSEEKPRRLLCTSFRLPLELIVVYIALVEETFTRVCTVIKEERKVLVQCEEFLSKVQDESAQLVLMKPDAP